MALLDKTYDEIISAELFRFLLKEDFPQGKLKKSESPDFILSLSPRESIGIEVIRLMDNARSSDQYFPARFEETKLNLLNTVKSKVAKITALKFYASFHFHHLLNDHLNIEEESEKIASTVLKSMEGHNLKHSFHYFSRFQITDLLLSSLSVFYHPEINFSQWELSDAYLLTDLNPDIIESAIRYKEEKLPLYMRNRLNEYWLLIVMELNYDQISWNLQNQIDNWNFRTRFNKVFLLARISGKVFELNIEH
jgi:hypothetical protein